MGINNRNYNTDNTVIEEPKTTLGSNKSSSQAGVNFAKIFGYMFAALGVTAIVATLVGLGFNAWIKSNNNVVPSGMNVILVVASILTVIVNLVMNFVCLNKGKGVKFAFFFFAALMGVTMASLTTFVDWYLLAVAFGLTAGVFAIMWLIALIGGQKLTPLAIVGTSVLFGAILVGSITALIVAFSTLRVNPTFVWIIDFVIFGAVMLITIYDISHINDIVRKSEVTDNTAIFCACTLYVDFIYIFIRILAIVARSRN